MPFPTPRNSRASIYLDYNATQPLKPEARDAMLDVLAWPANASSVHRPGQHARALVESARRQIGGMIGARPSEIVLTASATEANGTAIAGIARAAFLASAIEHPSVREWEPDRVIPVDRQGTVDLGALDRMLAAMPKPALVSIMLVNNETGVIQDVAEAARIVHAHGGMIHSDAAQAPGRIVVDVAALDVDLLTLSAHKIGGPQGAGALFIREGLAIRPLLRGGGQESRRRAGTENVAAIAGFGAAAAKASADLAVAGRIAEMRDRLESRLSAVAPDLVVHGRNGPRVGNTSCFGVPGLSAETALIALDIAGIAVSSGAACSSGAVEPSRVLLAMGAGEDAAREAIRVSLGWATAPADLDHLAESWSMVYRRSRAAEMLQRA